MTTKPAVQNIIEEIFQSEEKNKHPKRSQGINNFGTGNQKKFEKTPQKQ